jgi:hypothetical protein
MTKLELYAYQSNSLSRINKEIRTNEAKLKLLVMTDNDRAMAKRLLQIDAGLKSTIQNNIKCIADSLPDSILDDLRKLNHRS